MVDLILLHPPSVYDFRKIPALYGPVSDVVPSTQIFEMYPIGFMSLSGYLEQHGLSVRIVNVALRMLKNRRLDVEQLIRSLNGSAFGLDLHWLVHAQGSLELARIVKKCHPHAPVIFGGLSATYFHQELIRYPQVDYVISGDSAEEPLRQLLTAIKEGRRPEAVPNLSWKEGGQVNVNDCTHVPADLEQAVFDYRTVMSSSARHADLVGHLPFDGWLNYPIVAALCCRGCEHDCLTCGGSASAFKQVCARSSPAYRQPERVAQDIGAISRYFNSPIIILGDIRQAGSEYADRFLLRLQELRIKNPLALELFAPAPLDFFKQLSQAVPNYNLQISPESHDERIRAACGKHYDNQSLETTIEDALRCGCRRVDLFFMIGLPYQTPQSVQETIEYSDRLTDKFGRSGRLHVYISPLAPFLDPGSRAFEQPEQHGYRLIHHSLEDHRKALLVPSWKYTLNYETEWMSRDQIVASTYQAAYDLNRLKLKYGILSRRQAQRIEQRIGREVRIAADIDAAMDIDDEQLRQREVESVLSSANLIGHSTVCKKNEMRWPVRLVGFRIVRVLAQMLTIRRRGAVTHVRPRNV